jgi:hypothetical protein
VDEDRGEDAERGLRALLGRQSGVVSRRQALACGMAPYDLERLLRRRELARVVPGVFVDHTGELAWEQRLGGLPGGRRGGARRELCPARDRGSGLAAPP